MSRKASPKGRRPPSWTLTHLNTGHAIVHFRADEPAALDVVTEIACCGEWDFDGLTGYQNIDPTLADKVAAIINRYPKVVFLMGGGEQSAEVAQEIAIARAG